MNVLQAHDLTVLDDEPRVIDLRIAEALEFERPRDIRKLVERNADELGRYGALRHHVATPCWRRSQVRRVLAATSPKPSWSA